MLQEQREVVWSGGSVSVLGDVQKPPGHGQHASAGKGWTRWSPEVPSRLSQAVILFLKGLIASGNQLNYLLVQEYWPV